MERLGLELEPILDVSATGRSLAYYIMMLTPKAFKNNDDRDTSVLILCVKPLPAAPASHMGINSSLCFSAFNAVSC